MKKSRRAGNIPQIEMSYPFSGLSSSVYHDHGRFLDGWYQNMETATTARRESKTAMFLKNL